MSTIGAAGNVPEISDIDAAEETPPAAETPAPAQARPAAEPPAPPPVGPAGGVDARADALRRLTSDTALAASALHRLLPGRKSVGDQVLQVLRGCPSAADLDALLSKVGTDRLLERVKLVDGTNAPVAAAIDSMRAADVKPGDWKGFNRYLDQVTGTRAEPGNSVTLMNDGAEAFPQIFRAIDGAHDSVNLETFEFCDDKTGREYAQHLIDAAKRGVTVNVMMDAQGSDRHGGKDIAALLRCDGKTGFTGGMNIGDDWQFNWHDMHAKLEGPGVADLQRAFLGRWQEEGGAVPSRPDYFPDLAARGGQTVRVVPHAGGKDENLRMTYLRAIDTAEKSIKVEDPYFCDPEICAHLARAAARGVDVECVWPEKNNVGIAGAAGRAHYADLIAAGVKVFEYEPSMAHEKVCSIDGKFATIGSSNLDARSLENNNELNLVATDPKLAGDLEAAIANDITKSRQITHADADLFHRAVDSFLDEPVVDGEL